MKRIWLGVVVAALLACDDSGPTGLPDSTVVDVVVSPQAVSLLVGDTLTLVAQARTARGAPVNGLAVTWEIQGTDVVSVSGSGAHGRLKVLRAGSAAITATVAGKSGEATVQASNPAPQLVSLSPEAVFAGSDGFTLVVRGEGFVPDTRVLWDGNARPTTFVDPDEVWASIDPSDVEAVGTAQVRVVSPGPGGGTSEAAVFTVSETPPPAPGPVASVEISADSVVLEEGAALQLNAVARDIDGRVVTGRFVQWSSSDPEVALAGALGAISGIRTGSAVITAKVDGVTTSVPARVWTDLPYHLVFTGWDGQDASTLRIYRTELGDADRAAVRFGPDAQSGGGVPSPDGERIAYILDLPAGLRSLMVANSDGSGAVEIHRTGDFSCGRFSWSPDSEKVAFGCAIGDADRDIWVANADGGALVNLTDVHPGRQEYPSWSPLLPGGGSRIAYAQFIDGEPQIWTMATDGSDPRQVTAGMDHQPAWSPDGSTIAFQRTGAAIFGDIWLADATGGNERRLMPVALAGPQEAPAWSPDGRFVAFTSTHETYGTGGPLVRHVYTVWADGSRLARRTDAALDAALPAWRVR